MYMSESYLESLKASRERAGLTQKEVEDLLGMRSLMMRDYEIGRLKLPASVALQLAELYRVSVDDLLGSRFYRTKVQPSKMLSDFSSLFLGNGFGVMFLDPVIRAFMEGRGEELFEHSFFDLITHDLNEKHKKETVLDICRMLFSLASSDGKISDSEIECIRLLLGAYNLTSKYKEISVISSTHYIPSARSKTLERIEMRHFVVWVLFFFAHADLSLSHQELTYIEECAEALKMNRSNFVLIRKNFVKEAP